VRVVSRGTTVEVIPVAPQLGHVAIRERLDDLDRRSGGHVANLGDGSDVRRWTGLGRPCVERLSDSCNEALPRPDPPPTNLHAAHDQGNAFSPCTERLGSPIREHGRIASAGPAEGGDGPVHCPALVIEGSTLFCEYLQDHRGGAHTTYGGKKSSSTRITHRPTRTVMRS